MRINEPVAVLVVNLVLAAALLAMFHFVGH